MYYVYILWSKIDQKFYIGYTANLERRLQEHKNKKAYSTSRFHQPELVFFEAFASDKDARRREKYFKTTKGKKALKLMLRETINCPVV